MASSLSCCLMEAAPAAVSSWGCCESGSNHRQASAGGSRLALHAHSLLPTNSLGMDCTLTVITACGCLKPSVWLLVSDANRSTLTSILCLVICLLDNPARPLAGCPDLWIALNLCSHHTGELLCMCCNSRPSTGTSTSKGKTDIARCRSEVSRVTRSRRPRGHLQKINTAEDLLMSKLLLREVTVGSARRHSSAGHP